LPETETLRPVAWTFGAFGGFWGTWAVAAVDVERRLHLSHGRLGLLLTASVAAGGVVAAASGGVTHRMGTSRALAGALVLWGACVLGAAAAPGEAAFFVLFVAAMVLAGSVDAAMNTAVAIGAGGDPATMVRFHALFNAGALGGAALTGILLAAGATWRLSWVVVALTCFAVAAVARRSPLPGARPAPTAASEARRAGGSADGSAAGPGRFGWRAVRALRLRTLAAVFFGTALVEGGIDTWGVLYLRTHLGAGPLLGAGAYVMGQSIAVVVRWSSARHVGRIGARLGLAVGATVAAAGLMLEAASPAAAVAGLGLLVAIGGIALCWPLVMAVVSSAASAPSAAAGSPGAFGGPRAGATASATGGTTAAVVGAFTAVGYLGWVAGPAVVGWVADTVGLDTGLALLAGVAAAAAGLVLASTAGARAR
jgi:hypothetical protein